MKRTQNGWELRNLRPDFDSDKFFWYDESFECNCFEIVPGDIRLFSADELLCESEDLVDEFPDSLTGHSGNPYRYL